MGGIGTGAKQGLLPYHPAVRFFYFLAVIGCSMIMLHPITLAFSFAGALLYLMRFGRPDALRRTLMFIGPMAFLVVIWNPLFHHRGMTPLFYLPTGNAITLEAILFSLAAGLMFACVMAWFACYQSVVDMPATMYIFGRILPSMALLLSVTSRLFPVFSSRFKQTFQAQSLLAREEKKTLKMRLLLAKRVLSSQLMASLEIAVNMSDSMRARGYGGKKRRSSYHTARFLRRDAAFVAVFAVLGVLIISGFFARAFFVTYYPQTAWPKVTPVAILAQAAFGLFCFLPVIFGSTKGQGYVASTR